MVRKLCEADLDRAAEIHVFSWRTAYAGLIPEDYLYKEIGIGRSREGAKKHVGGDNFHVIEDNGILRGIMIHGEGRAEEDKGFYEVYAIYVDPQFVRMGYGEKLLSFAEEHAKASGKSEIILYALEKNINARNFYEKNGYKSDGSLKFEEKWNVNQVRYIKNI